jgi:transposase
MNKHTLKLEQIESVAIDLSKRHFHVYAVDRKGRKVLSNGMSRKGLVGFMTQLPESVTVGMEACGSAHYWGRVFQMQGHQVRLMAPQFVKPYVKSNKTDAADAEAIAEAMQRPGMRFVSVKQGEQQDIQSLHRVRSMAVRQRTQQVNQIRGLLLEYGIEIPKGRAQVRQHLPVILEDGENGLSAQFRALLADLYTELVHHDERIDELTGKLEQLAKETPMAKRLMTIPGIGALIATALLASVGDAKAFASGRQMAAWLGLVPRQHSTGGQPRLLGISKRGDCYLRSLLIHGGRAVVRCAARKEDRTSRWITEVEGRRGRNVAAVATANKIVRTAWALLTNGGEYQPATAA